MKMMVRSHDGLRGQLICSRRTRTVYRSVSVVILGVWLLALFSMPGLYLDTYEMFAFGHDMQLGYWKHPPLPPWLVEIAYRLT